MTLVEVDFTAHSIVVLSVVGQAVDFAAAKPFHGLLKLQRLCVYFGYYHLFRCSLS